VETIKFESTDLMVKALISGDLDVLIGINTLTAFAAEQASPNKLKIFTGQVYTTEEYADEIIVSKDSELSSIQDLRGKKIGLMPGSGFTEFMKIILEKNNLSENDVELSQMESKILPGKSPVAKNSCLGRGHYHPETRCNHSCPIVHSEMSWKDRQNAVHHTA